MSSCHDHGYTLAGTVSASRGGGVPMIGASITVVDAAKRTFDLVTQMDGTFRTKTLVTFPVTVIASSCPDTMPMAGPIAIGGGNCNMAGCHVAGVGTGAVHLP